MLQFSNGVISIDMAKLIVFMSILSINHILRSSCNLNSWTKTDDLLSLIDNFSKQFNQDDNCLQALSKEVDRRNLFETWNISTSIDLYSLNWYSMIGEDMKCKLGKMKEKNNLNRYCLYEIYDDNLPDSFLFTSCIPPSCNETHVEVLGRLAHNRTKKEKKSVFEATVQCSRSHDDSGNEALLHLSAIWMCVFVAALLTIVASIMKCKETRGQLVLTKKWRKFAYTFSDQINCRKLIASNPKTDINILHFMRVISMVIMIFGHFHECTQMLAANGEDFRNPTGFLWLCSNATIFVGTFFVIGGTLSTYVTLCKYAKNDQISIVNGKEQILAAIKSSIVPWSIMIVNRYIRIIFLFFFFIFILISFRHLHSFIPFINVDPLIQCPPRIWEHVLLISNFDYRPYCMIWAWYLDVDFQLFVLTRPVVWLFVYKPFWAFITSLGLIMGSSVIRIVLMIYYDLPPAMSFIMQFPSYNTNYLLNHLINHSKPYTWFSSYAVGTMVGYAAFHLRFRRSFKLKPSIQRLLWICTTVVFAWSIFGIYWSVNGFKNTVYDGFYISCAPLFWSIACGWIILHSHNFSNSISVVQKFYQSKFLTFLSNLSFASGLINLPLAYMVIACYAHVFHDKPKIYFSKTLFVGLFCVIYILCYIISFFLYLIVEGPASHLRVIFPKRTAKVDELKSN